jgi:hypothetical protein
MKKTVTVFAMLVLLLGMAAHPSFAFGPSTISPDALGLSNEEGVVNNPVSGCFWGLYIDDRGPGLGPWDSLLFLSNPSATAQNFDVINFARGRRVVNSYVLRPDELIALSCDDLGVCGTQGWLLIISDASIFGGTLFLVNSVFAGGGFDAQTPFCFSF